MRIKGMPKNKNKKSFHGAVYVRWPLSGTKKKYCQPADKGSTVYLGVVGEL